MSCRTSSVDGAAGHDGELLEGAGVTLEVEALVVVVAVGVRGAASGGAGLEVAAGSDGGGVDLGGSVVLRAAGGSSATLEIGRSSAHGGREGEAEGGDGQLHLVGG